MICMLIVSVGGISTDQNLWLAHWGLHGIVIKYKTRTYTLRRFLVNTINPF